jgi:hypothetical protein
MKSNSKTIMLAALFAAGVVLALKFLRNSENGLGPALRESVWYIAGLLLGLMLVAGSMRGSK